MRTDRMALLAVVLLTMALAGPACTQETGRKGRRGETPAPTAEVPPAPAPAPAAVPAAPAPAPTAAAAPAEEPQAYSATESLEAPAPATPAATPAAAAATPKPAEISTVEPKETYADSEPPDPVFEARPKAPTPTAVWTPGFWDWAGTRWVWRAGAWRARPAGLVYVAPHYEVVSGRLVFVRPYFAKAAAPRYYGGRVVPVRPATVKPAWWRPGVRVVVRPTVGFKIGTRPVAVYRTLPKVTRRVVVPPRPIRVVRRPGMPLPGRAPMVMPRPLPGKAPMVAPGPRRPGAHPPMPMAPGKHPLRRPPPPMKRRP